MDEEKTTKIKEKEEEIIEIPQESECVECRVRVEYVGWDWFTYKRVYRYYSSTTLSTIPLVIDKGIIQSKKLGSIVLEAKVVKESSPCNCKSIVDGKITHVSAGMVWNTWSINWYTVLKTLGVMAIPTFIDLKKIGLGLTGPFGISAMLHTLVLTSLEAKIKEFGHVTVKRGVQIDCTWNTLVTVFDLGRVPMTRAIAAEVKENGKLICKILLHFR